MSVKQRSVIYIGVRAEQASKSKKFNQPVAGYGFLDALSSLDEGMVQKHRGHPAPDQDEGPLLGFTRLRALERTEGHTLLLLEYGTTEDADPMLGNADTGEHEHVTLEGEQMQAWAGHLLISHSPDAAGVYPAVLEYVRFISRTRVEAFLNHLFWAEEKCRHQRKSYMVYQRVSCDALADYSMREFLDFDGVSADFELVVPSGKLDSQDDEVFEVTYRRQSSTSWLKTKWGTLMNRALGRSASLVRIRARYKGATLSGEFADFDADLDALRLGRTSVIVFDPPLTKHHTAIDAFVRDELVDRLYGP